MSISRYPDFEHTTHLETQPAEAVADPRDLGLDLDHDGNPWYPADTGTLVRPMAIVLVLLAAVFGVLFGPDVAAWWALR